MANCLSRVWARTSAVKTSPHASLAWSLVDIFHLLVQLMFQASVTSMAQCQLSSCVRTILKILVQSLCLLNQVVKAFLRPSTWRMTLFLTISMVKSTPITFQKASLWHSTPNRIWLENRKAQAQEVGKVPTHRLCDAILYPLVCGTAKSNLSELSILCKFDAHCQHIMYSTLPCLNYLQIN